MLVLPSLIFFIDEYYVTNFWFVNAIAVRWSVYVMV